MIKKGLTGSNKIHVARHERYMQRLQDIYGHDQEKIKIVEEKLRKELYEHHNNLQKGNR
jgi:hypothetical protein